ncbi:tetratricopeptide repeat protein [Aureimonas psammosilenae]|uniref:tetratricopeptide repeat protein n=1 Tax=Aureimonas psammosilenae TaxID=2495496 RepID=UPI001260AB86|nr:tetratricopeptide repeat protein [Aureimonas psammosilenae]
MEDETRKAGREKREAGLAARRAGQREAAWQAFQAAVLLDPADLWSRNDATLELLALGRLSQAEAEVRALLNERSDFAPAHRTLGLLTRAQGLREDALSAFREASRLQPTDLWNRHDIGVELQHLGRLDEAEAAFRAVAENTPLAHALRGLAGVSRSRGDLATALERFRAASLLAPADPWFALDVAQTLRALGREAEAEAACGLILERHPGFAPALLERADNLSRLGRAEDARSILARHLVRDPASIDAYRGLARIARGEGDGASAVRHLRAAFALKADDPILALDLASALRASGHMEEGRALLRQAERLAPDEPRVLLALADDRREAGDLDAAMSFYDAASSKRPDFYWALTGKAATVRLRGDAGGAEALLRQAIAIDALEGHAQIELAALFRDRNEMDKARAVLAAMSPASPRAAEAAMAASLIRRAEGDWKGAADAFEEVATRFPAKIDALVEAAEDAFRAGDPERSARLLALGAQRAPDHPALREALARRALLRDDLGEAEAHLSKAAARDPARLWPPLALARIRALKGEGTQAFAEISATERRFGPRPEIVLSRADLLRQTGDTSAALACLREAAARFPHHAPLRFALIAASIEAGAFEEAERQLDVAPSRSREEEGRGQLLRCLLHSARWDFAAAIAAGEEAVARLPGDGWPRNRLIHAALLHLDLDRAGRHLADLAALEASASALRGKSANPSQSHYGQLFDEFRLDGELLDALVAAKALPMPGRIEASSRLVRDNPDSTPAALQYLIALRRAGRFSAAPEPEENAAMPRVIHQYWDEPPPPADLLSYMASWRDHNPGFNHRLWSEGEARAFLAARLPRDASVAFERAREPAMKADLFRLALLATEGGIYVDADDRCLAPLDPLLPPGRALVLYQEDLGSTGNNFIAAMPGHPILADALERAVHAINRGDTDILWLSTGPGLLSRCVAGHLAQREASARGLLVLDRHEWARFSAIHCLAAYKATERHWSRTAFGRAKPAQATSAR